MPFWESLPYGCDSKQRTAEDKLYLLVAIDRTSKFAFTELHDKATRRFAADFLYNLIKAIPYKVHTVLADNGKHFTDPAGESWSVADIKAMMERKELFWAHAFEVACAGRDTDHRLTKRKHPWTNGQVERMNPTSTFPEAPALTHYRRPSSRSPTRALRYRAITKRPPCSRQCHLGGGRMTRSLPIQKNSHP
jgi:transposase InsO family protein